MTLTYRNWIFFAGSHLLSRAIDCTFEGGPSLTFGADKGDAVALGPPNLIPISGVHIPGAGEGAAATGGGPTLALVGNGAASGGSVRGVARGCCCCINVSCCFCCRRLAWLAFCRLI